MTKVSQLFGVVTATAMTNYNGIHDEKICDSLKKEKMFAQYSGQDFCGLVWFDKRKKKYFCEVHCYHSHVDTKEADTPEELMEEVSEKYGYE